MPNLIVSLQWLKHNRQPARFRFRLKPNRNKCRFWHVRSSTPRRHSRWKVWVLRQSNRRWRSCHFLLKDDLDRRLHSWSDNDWLRHLLDQWDSLCKWSCCEHLLLCATDNHSNSSLLLPLLLQSCQLVVKWWSSCRKRDRILCWMRRFSRLCNAWSCKFCREGGIDFQDKNNNRHRQPNSG